MNAIPILVLGLLLFIGLIVALVQAVGKGVAFVDQHSAQILPTFISALTILGIVLGAVVGSLLFLILMGALFLYVEAYERDKEMERREAEHRERERQRQEVEKPLIPTSFSEAQVEDLKRFHNTLRSDMADLEDIRARLNDEEAQS